MTLLDRIDWPAVADAAHGSASPLAFAHAVRARGRYASARHQLEAAVDTAGHDLDRLDVLTVTEWLIQTAEAVTTADVLDQPPRATRRDPELEVLAGAVRAVMASADDAALRIDPRLIGRFPHLPLAYDLANRQAGGLTIGVGRLGGQLLGCGSGATGIAVITIDAALLDDPAALAATARHELGHALDPRLDARQPYQRERFADALAGLLAEHDPTTVADTTDLVEWAERMTPPPVDRVDLPAPGPASVAAFRTLLLRAEALAR